MTTKIATTLKLLTAATMLAIAFASPSLAQNAQRQDDGGAGYYRGYPTEQWYNQDRW
jgi:hypothetical protein